MGDLLRQLSEDLAGLVETAGGSVVRVDGRRRLSASGIVWSDDGIIVTANHTVTRTENLTVGLPTGETVAAEVAGFDQTTDILVLRADASGLSVPTFAETSDVKTGHLVTALARPGRTVQATLGMLSAVGSEWRTAAGGRIDAWLNTDVVMYPGFSGGPLVAADGRVLGMMTSAFRGASLAIPVSTLRRVAGSLLAHGRVRRPWLGVAVQAASLPPAASEAAGHERGLLVTSVEPGSPADAAGILVGDILASLGGHVLQRADDLMTALSDHDIGDEVSASVARGGEIRSIDVTLGERERTPDQ